MLSRVANSIYWLTRYMERAENYARYVSVNLNLALDLPAEVDNQWEPILIATADEYIFNQHYEEINAQNVIKYMCFDERNPNSILSSLQYARENARTIREVISKEMWEHTNKLYWLVSDAANNSSDWELSDFQNFFDEVKMGTQLFFGIVDSTITRNEAWHFGHLGRMLERADKVTRFLDIKYFTLLPSVKQVGSPLDLLMWTSVLKSASAYNMFRQQFKIVNPINIVNFLLLDKDFPRSLLFCMRYAENSLYKISGNNLQNKYSNEAERLCGQLRSKIEFTNIDLIFEIGLHSFLDDFQKENNAVGQAVFKTYFDLKPILTV